MKGRVTKKSFLYLQKIAWMAFQPEQTEKLVAVGAEKALVERAVHGNKLEQRWAMQGLMALSNHSERSLKIKGAAQHIKKLLDITVLTKEDVDAMGSFSNLLEDNIKAAVKIEELDRELRNAIAKLKTFKKSRSRVSDFISDDAGSDSRSSTSSDVFFGTGKIRRRGTIGEKKRKATERRKEKKSRAKEAFAEHKKETDELRSRITKLESSKDALFNDAPIFEAMGSAKMLQKCTHACKGRLKLKFKNLLLKAWTQMAKLSDVWQEHADACVCVKKVQDLKRLKSADKSRERLSVLAQQLRGFGFEQCQMCVQLGVVDDLLSITQNHAANVGAIECLRIFANQDTKAQAQVALYDDLRVEMAAADGEGDLNDELLLFTRLREKINLQRKGRKRKIAADAEEM